MWKNLILGAIAPLCLIGIAGPAQAGEFNPYLPAPGGGSVDFNYIHQNSRVIREDIGGKTRYRFWEELSQNSQILSANYGVTDKFAINARLGYAETDMKYLGDTAISGKDGFSDTLIGFRYRLADEFANAPITVTVGASGIIRGLYSPTAIDSIGEQSSGAQLGVSFGKWVTPKLALTGEVGGRLRFAKVPEELFVSVGASYSFSNRVDGWISMTHADSLGGIDILGPGFVSVGPPEDFNYNFQEVEEDTNVADIGGSVRVWKGMAVTGSYGRRFLGRNTLQGGFFRIGLSYNF